MAEELVAEVRQKRRCESVDRLQTDKGTEREEQDEYVLRINSVLSLFQRAQVKNFQEFISLLSSDLDRRCVTNQTLTGRCGKNHVATQDTDDLSFVC